jgi:hypothetical protein
MKGTLLLSVLMFELALALPAAAGAATGMPSPFMPPFPDFGCCGRCTSHAAVSWHCPGFTRPSAHLRVTARAGEAGHQSRSGGMQRW